MQMGKEQYGPHQESVDAVCGSAPTPKGSRLGQEYMIPQKGMGVARYEFWNHPSYQLEFIRVAFGEQGYRNLVNQGKLDHILNPGRPPTILKAYTPLRKTA